MIKSLGFLFLALLLTVSQCEDTTISTVEVDATGAQHTIPQSPQRPATAEAPQRIKQTTNKTAQTDQTAQTQQTTQQKTQATRRPTSQPTAVGIKIKNSRNEPLDYYWFNGREGKYQGRIHPRGVTATNSYDGHVFYVTPMKQPEYELYRFEVTSDENLYLVPPTTDSEYDVNKVMSNEDEAFWNELIKEKEFMQEYRERTGRPWLAHYPRDPPILPMWNTDYIGQIHTVISNNTYWTCIPEDISSYTEVQLLDISLPCRVHEPITIELEVVNMEPKVFLIKNTLSDAEADLIIDLAKPKIHRSLAGQDGGMVSDTRTSYNTWLGRKKHKILETIYRRAADILGLDQAVMWSQKNTEELQVLNYQVGQEYTSHHDFGASGRPNQRMITLLFYLNNQISPNAGGETSFPKAVRNDTKVFKHHPGKGNSVMFYSMLEDGNADDLSLHAALPVKEGEKWLANFWVWDPKR